MRCGLAVRSDSFFEFRRPELWLAKNAIRIEATGIDEVCYA